MTVKQSLYLRIPKRSAKDDTGRRGPMKLWQRAVIMTAVSLCMAGGVQWMYGGPETGPAIDDRINEPRGPAAEPPRETQDPTAAYGPALESEQKENQEEVQ